MQYLETHLVVPTGGSGAISIWWAETRDAAKHPTAPGTVPHTKEVSSPTVNRLRNPGVYLAQCIPDKWLISYCIL